MRFAAPHYLWLLLALPPGLVVFFWWSWRAKRKLMTQFVQARLLPSLMAGVSSRRQKLRVACLVGAVVFLIVALARPQWGYHLQEIRQRGLDIVVAIDTSRSMLAEDIAPNRLARAKLAALNLMQQAKYDRLGLVAFAGGAFLQCPLTLDDTAFQQSVEALNVNTIPQGGTAIAGAINTALAAFKKSDNYKILVLFTDGEDHDSGALAAAKRAAKAGLHIFTIGIGSAKGALLRITDTNGQPDYIRDAQGNVVKSRLNEELLRQIAGATKGFYLPLRGANPMKVLYQKGLAPLPKSESHERWLRRPIERYRWPLGLAIVLLVAEMFFPERKRPSVKQTARKSSKAQMASAAVLVALLFVPPGARASASSALRDYHSGKFDQSYQEFERLLQKHAADPKLHFDAGAAAYRNQKFNDAARHFDEALTSQNLKLQEQAYYNLGNTLYRLGEQDRDLSKRSQSWKKALKQYQSSLKLNPKDTDAKYNYNYVKKKLEQLKKQQQQQKKNSQRNQSQKNKKQQQKQQNGQSKKNQNRQQKSQPQSKNGQHKSSPQQSQQKKSQQNQKQPAQPKPSQNKKKSPQKQEQPKPSPAQQKKQHAKKQAESGKHYAPGQMTPQQARQLLNSQKGKELMLPAKPKANTYNPHGPVENW